MAKTALIPVASVEYLHATVNASVVLSSQVVETVILTSGEPDDTTTWVTAEWVGSPAQSRDVRVLIGPGTDFDLAPGAYSLWIRVHDNPEIPVRNAGQFKVT